MLKASKIWRSLAASALVAGTLATMLPTPAFAVGLVATATPTPSATASPSQSSSPSPTSSRTSSPTSTKTPPVSPTPTVTPSFQVWPIPFNPLTAVGGTLKFRGLPTGAKVGIFTVSGEKVRSLAESGGYATWDGRNEAGQFASAGTYYYIVEAGAEATAAAPGHGRRTAGDERAAGLQR